MSKIKITIKRKEGKPAYDSQTLKKAVLWLEQIIPPTITSWIFTNQPFKSQSGMAAKSWKVTVDGNILKITNLMPYTYWLNDGVRPHVMTYLLNGKHTQRHAFGKYAYWGRTPVPIPGAAGFFFRTPTPASFAAGKWKHPGTIGSHFLEKSLSELIETVKTQLPNLQIDLTTL